MGIGYGVLANQWHWFPSPQLRQAWNQAEVRFGIDSPGHSWSRSYDREGVRVPYPEKVQPGLRLIATSYDPGTKEPKLTLLDTKGAVVHEWEINRKEIFPNVEENMSAAELHGSYLLPNGDVLFNLDYAGMTRMDACSNVKWKLKEKNTHHSIERASDGTFWAPGVVRDRNTNDYPGLENPKIDYILNINQNGKIEREINLLDVIYENGLERYIAKSDASSSDPTHLNDVEPLSKSMADEYPLFESGDLVVSLRTIDLVFVFDPQSLEVRWHSIKPFIAQHDPDFTGGGWIGIFDNNRDGTKTGTMLGGSRIVSIQPHTDSVNVRFPTPKADPFYTAIMGKWQGLENGNMLLAETTAGRAAEVDSLGRTVWEIVQPSGKITKASLHDLTRKDIASWPCSSVDSVSTSNQSK
nr:arylsulfotransferase family protein [Salinibacter ruber]